VTKGSVCVKGSRKIRGGVRCTVQVSAAAIWRYSALQWLTRTSTGAGTAVAGVALVAAGVTGAVDDDE